MLRLECPECKEWIHSPLILEMDEMQCPACAACVRVKEVFVSAGPFSISREVLLKNMFKYRRLAEAERELEEIEGGRKAGRPYEITAESVRAFVTNLRELLEGCRESVRIPAENTKVICSFGEGSLDGRLVNLSTTGICIDTGGSAPEPRKGSEATVSFAGHGETGLGGAGGFNVRGEVMWAGRGSQVGIRFLQMDSQTRGSLVDYIQRKMQ